LLNPPSRNRSECYCSIINPEGAPADLQNEVPALVIKLKIVRAVRSQGLRFVGSQIADGPNGTLDAFPFFDSASLWPLSLPQRASEQGVPRLPKKLDQDP
jgi:hypothetical protein